MPSQPNSFNIHNVVQGAIYEVLCRHLPQDKAAVALDVWDDKYQDKHLSGLVGFLKDVSLIAPMSQDGKHAMRMDLYKTLYDLNSSRGGRPAPAKPVAAADPPGNVSTRMLRDRDPNAPPEIIVFVSLAENMISGAQKIGFREFGFFIEALQEHLERAALPDLLQQNLVDWANHRGQLLKQMIPREQLSHILHIFYVALCEAAGPVAGDAILNHAVREVEMLPEARLFSPKRLL